MNNRQSPAERKKLLVPFDVTTDDGSERLGYLADLSETGLMFVTELSFEQWSTFRLRIEVPQEGVDPDHLVADVEVIWTRPNINPELTCVGCRFTDVPEGELQRLLAVAREYAVGPEYDVHRVPPRD